jgi:hypothetical protein
MRWRLMPIAAVLFLSAAAAQNAWVGPGYYVYLCGDNDCMMIYGPLKTMPDCLKQAQWNQESAKDLYDGTVPYQCRYFSTAPADMLHFPFPG